MVFQQNLQSTGIAQDLMLNFLNRVATWAEVSHTSQPSFFLVKSWGVSQIIEILVGGFKHLDYFSTYWECHHPN